MHDTLRDRMRLSGSGSSIDEKGSVDLFYSFALCGIEVSHAREYREILEKVEKILKTYIFVLYLIYYYIVLCPLHLPLF